MKVENYITNSFMIDLRKGNISIDKLNKIKKKLLIDIILSLLEEIKTNDDTYNKCTVGRINQIADLNEEIKKINIRSKEDIDLLRAQFRAFYEETSSHEKLIKDLKDAIEYRDKKIILLQYELQNLLNKVDKNEN